MQPKLSARPGSRKMNGWERLLERVAASKPGGWFFVHIANRIDPILLRATRGRLSLAVGQPVALLRTIGARSGEPRITPLLYLVDGGNVVFVASNAGNLRHPAWYHNVRANPQVEIDRGGRRRRYLAHFAEGEERERLWELVNDLYAGYDVYQHRAGDRRIPVVVCAPV
jgi:deazaflavin-dependent oxidoreductase (nitroreductase family)